MNHRRHLHQGVSALVDGELGHDARDRALAHLAHCDGCRLLLDAERSLKARLARAPAPGPSDRLLSSLRRLSEAPSAPSGRGIPPSGRGTPPISSAPWVGPLVPIVPALPPPGRFAGSLRPRGRGDGGRPGEGSYRRAPRRRPARVAAAGALSVGVLMLGTAFAAGGAQPQPAAPVIPQTAEFTIEHAATTAGLPLRDPAFDAVAASLGGLSFPSAPATAAPGR